MQRRHALRDDQWERIKGALPGKEEDPGRTCADNRLFIEAVMWIAKTGAPWRDLPTQYGKWSNVHKRFMRWAKKGVWQMIFNTLAVDADTEWLMIDSTIVRAHQHAAGARGGQQSQALGRSRGGFGTKIHALSDAHGNPMKFILTGGEKSDYLQALPLLSGESASAVLADKGYDADYIVTEVLKMNAEAVIPPRNTRKTPREYDHFLCKERNVIERMFGKMKHFRSVATRYSKMAVSYLAFAQLVAILLWFK